MYIYMFYLSDHSLTHLLSYPNSRDAIASKNYQHSFLSRRKFENQKCLQFSCIKLSSSVPVLPLI